MIKYTVPIMLGELNKKSEVPLYRQLYSLIKSGILAGTLKSGNKLPSSRKLAENAGVSRNTVLEAYEILAAEGFLEFRKGDGTYIAEGTEFRNKNTHPSFVIPDVGFKPFRTDIIDFRSGLPDLNYFPVKIWNRLSREQMGKIRPADLSYQSPEGRTELREAIAEYLNTERGTFCRAEQIVITAGTTQAIGIITQLLTDNYSSHVLIEDPVTMDIPMIISGRNGKVVSVPIDENGIDTDNIPEISNPSFIYTTPSHQYPLGTILSAKKRIQLLKYAVNKNCFIVEDDYDSEFRYDGPPVSTIHSLDPEKVIYIGTFSKTLFPALRTAFIILPEKLIEKGRLVKWVTDLHNASVDQLILADFIGKGYYSRHISRMKKIYRKRRDFLTSYLKIRFMDRIELFGYSTGIHLCARFSSIIFSDTLLEKIEKKGVRIYQVEKHSLIKGRWDDTIILGFGMLDIPAIKKGVDILYDCLQFGN